jgi:hypothetical protein
MPAAAIDRASGEPKQTARKKAAGDSGGFLVTMMPIDERDLS